MRDLIILGTGVHGAEMAEIVERINQVKPTWKLRGYLSPDGKHISEERNGYRVLGPADSLANYPNACFVPDYEWPKTYPVPRERLVSIIDPSAFVSRTAEIGRGCVIYPGCYVGLNARIGDYLFCLSRTVINHDDVIGDRVALASGVTLAGSVTVEDDCYLGQSCTVRQLLRIGRDSMIGMGAVVVKDVAPNSVIVGNPGRRMRNNR